MENSGTSFFECFLAPSKEILEGVGSGTFLELSRALGLGAPWGLQTPELSFSSCKGSDDVTLVSPGATGPALQLPWLSQDSLPSAPGKGLESLHWLIPAAGRERLGKVWKGPSVLRCFPALYHCYPKPNFEFNFSQSLRQFSHFWVG